MCIVHKTLCIVNIDKYIYYSIIATYLTQHNIRPSKLNTLSALAFIVFSLLLYKSINIRYHRTCRVLLFISATILETLSQMSNGSLPFPITPEMCDPIAQGCAIPSICAIGIIILMKLVPVVCVPCPSVFQKGLSNGS